jgi:hypothetical protein
MQMGSAASNHDNGSIASGFSSIAPPARNPEKQTRGRRRLSFPTPTPQVTRTASRSPSIDRADKKEADFRPPLSNKSFRNYPISDPAAAKKSKRTNSTKKQCRWFWNCCIQDYSAPTIYVRCSRVIRANHVCETCSISCIDSKIH